MQNAADIDKLKIRLKSADLTSECNVTSHVDAYASGYVFFNVSGGEHVFGPFACFYLCFPDWLQGNVFTFCRNWWVWCPRHWKYALRNITGRARWPDLLVVLNIMQIQHGREKLWTLHRLLVCVHCDLDIRYITMAQGHDTSLDPGRWVWEIVSRSNMAVRSYVPDTGVQYVCTVTLTLEIWL